jgi:hypothetical protein
MDDLARDMVSDDAAAHARKDEDKANGEAV